MNLVTTSTNYQFITDCFISAKKELKKEIESGVINPNRLKGIGLEGASRSGKSWDICVFLCQYISKYTGKQINVCRDTKTNLTKTIYETFKKVWSLYGWPTQDYFNRSTTPIYVNGNIIRFVGINDDIMVAHGLESDLLIINEAMGVDKATVDQLEQRCNEFFIYDYNPSAVESWLYDLEERPDYKVHRTTIFDNKYAPLNAKQKILSYAHPETDDKHIAIKAGYNEKQWEELKEKNVKLKTANKYAWEVYGLGKRAVGEDIIFEDWVIYDDEPELNTVDWVYLGGDFGFKDDPTTCIRVTKAGNCLYLREEFYKHGLLNNEIAAIMKKKQLDYIRSIWDRAEEKSIFELREMGIDAWYSEKGVNSVAYGIQKMQQFNLKIHKNSINLQSEFNKYRWIKDKNGDYKRNTYGRRIPIDKDNHTIDAVRYVILYHYRDTLDYELDK